MREESIVETGIALLDRFEDTAVSLAETMDRLEAITTDHRLLRTILDEAVTRDIIDIDREEGRITPLTGTYHRFQSDIRTKRGSFSCVRCGRSLSTGYFLVIEEREIGPYGSSCIRQVTGRD